MNRKIPVIVVVLLIFVTILSLSACNVQRRPGDIQQTPNRTTNRTPSDQQLPTPGVNDASEQDALTARNLADRISTMNEVSSATVVISGNRAWVGVDLTANAGNALTTEVKDNITKTVKTKVPRITTVYVTADADTVTRLRNVARDVLAGKPISGFADELSNITNRIMPTAR